MRCCRIACLSTCWVLVLGSIPFNTLRADDENAPETRTALRITLRGAVHESDPPFQLFGAMGGTSLREVVAAIRKAKDDDKVAALVLRLKGPALGWTQVQALRRELLGFRKGGKLAFAHLDAAGSADFLLASACSQVSMTPSGILEVPGVSAQLIFYKGLLDKLGVRFQELRMGRYKSAAESFTRDAPSDATLEVLHSLLDEIFDEYVESLAENRSLHPVVVRALIDKALFRADEAKKAGLVDHVEYEDEFLARVQGENTKLADAKLSKGLDLDLSGLGGLMKLMNELFGGGRKRASSANPKLAIVYGEGAIIEGGGAPSLFGGAILAADDMVKTLREVRRDETVKAVVFRVNSPGGSALASDRIWREVKLLAREKPVVVSMGDVAGSGGYYISCGATWIVAERNTITGSIGVIGAVPSLQGLFDKVGLSVTSIARGKNAQMVSATGEISEEGREILMKYLRSVYDDFLARVSEGRKLSTEAVASIAEGRVWTGRQALQHGLVDEIGGLDAALAKARELSKAPADAEMLILPRPKDLFSLLSGLGGEDAALRMAVRALPAEALELLRGLEWIRLAGKERALTVMPELLRIR
jgi:protease-4